jgi:hypothetical protein
MVEKSVLSISCTLSARKLYSRTGCLQSAQINMCDVGRNISNQNKPAINGLSENQNPLNSNLHKRGYFLDISIKETYERKFLTN